MNKLFSITSPDFLEGLNTSLHTDLGPAFYSGEDSSWFPFFLNEKLKGVLASTSISSAVISATDAVFQGAAMDSGGTYGNVFYATSDAGYIYKGDVYNVNASTKKNVTAITNLSEGITVYKTKGGTKYVYYWNGTQIGQWDPSGSTFTNNWATGLDSATDPRPVHNFEDRVYYGNGYKLGYIYDNAGTATNDTNVLDFPATYTIKGISDDGQYLIIALSDGVNVLLAFWDTNSSTWSRIWRIDNAGNVIGVRRAGLRNYLLTGGSTYSAPAIYQFDFVNSPDSIVDLVDAYTQPSVSNSNSHTLSVWKDGIIWISSTGTGLCYFGKATPDSKRRLFRIASAVAGYYILGVSADQKYIKIGGSGGKEVSVDMTGGTSGVVDPINAYTRYINLGNQSQINAIEVVLAEALTSGQSVSVSYKTGEDDSSFTSFGSFAYTQFGATKRQAIRSSVITDQIRLYITATNGVRIKSIHVYGDQITRK